MAVSRSLEHDPEMGTGFPKRSCSNKKMDDEHVSTRLNHLQDMRDKLQWPDWFLRMNLILSVSSERGEGTAAHVRASAAGDDAVAKLTATIPALGKFAG
jgi:hypothetical protein